MKSLIPPLIAGLLFGFGLAFSGMTDTHKVIGFLDIFGAWDYDLAFVMGGAVLVALISYRWISRRQRSLLGFPFEHADHQGIDRQLLLGSVCFGVGWGLFGYCPGPAIISILYLETANWLFLAAMVAGMWTASGRKITS